MTLRKEVLKVVYPEEYEYLNAIIRVRVYDSKRLVKRIIYAFKRDRETAIKIVDTWNKCEVDKPLTATEAMELAKYQEILANE